MNKTIKIFGLLARALVYLVLLPVALLAIWAALTFTYQFIAIHCIPKNVKAFVADYDSTKLKELDSISDFTFEYRYRSYNHTRIIDKELDSVIVFRADMDSISNLTIVHYLKKWVGECGGKSKHVVDDQEIAPLDTNLEKIVFKKMIKIKEKYQCRKLHSDCGNNTEIKFKEGILYSSNSSKGLEAISKIVPDQNHYCSEFSEAKKIHRLILPSIA